MILPKPNNFPVEDLPPRIKNAVQEVLYNTQFPLPLIVSSALGAVAAACQNAIDVQLPEKLFITDAPSQTTLGDFCPKNTFATHPDNPLNESECNWLFKTRDDNGFKKAFVKVNKRKFLVHIPMFITCLAERRGA